MTNISEPTYLSHPAASVLSARTDHGGGAAGAMLGAATIAMGLIAGAFYTYACSVMLGLAETDDRTFIEVMQHLNVEIENAVFFASFLGALGLTAVAAWMLRRLGQRAATRWTVAALVLYGGAFVVSMAFNVPIGEELNRAGDPASIADPAAVRDRFEGPWVAWNIVRTVAATAALACLGRALMLHGRAAQMSRTEPAK